MFGFPMQTQTSNGLVIRMQPILEEEMVAVPEQLAHYQVCAHLGLRGAQSQQQELDWLKNHYENTDFHGWGIYLMEEGSGARGRLVGTSGIGEINNLRGESGVVVWDRNVWGQGIATAIHRARCMYAVDVLGLVAIDSSACLTNKGSHRALCGVGYVKTGMGYSRGFAHGTVCHVMQLLWVNPAGHSWNFFWRDSTPPKKFVKGRERAEAALEQAREAVKFL